MVVQSEPPKIPVGMHVAFVTRMNVNNTVLRNPLRYPAMPDLSSATSTGAENQDASHASA